MKDIPWGMLFVPAPGEFFEEDLQDGLDFLVRMNLRYFQRHPNHPRLKECSNLIYIAEEDIGGVEIQWFTPFFMLRNGGGDCKGAAAWEAADLIRDGDVGARARGRMVENGPRIRKFHCDVVTGDGIIIDPSARMGMYKKVRSW